MVETEQVIIAVNKESEENRDCTDGNKRGETTSHRIIRAISRRNETTEDGVSRGGRKPSERITDEEEETQSFG